MTPAFDEGLRALLEGHLASFPRRSVELGESRAAAVAVVVVPGEEGRAAVLLTRRAAGLRRHGRQWALPGGRLDPAGAAGGRRPRRRRSASWKRRWDSPCRRRASWAASTTIRPARVS